MLFIDCDNGLGSNHGDVDDAFALLAMITNGCPILGISPANGNVTCSESFFNCESLLYELGRTDIPLLPLHEFSKESRAQHLRSILNSIDEPFRILALAPLSNFATIWSDPKIRGNCQEIVIVGGNTKSRGLFPPIWPFEFNLTKDRDASFALLENDLPLTFIPLNSARCLSVPFSKIESLPAPFGPWLSRRSERWWKRHRRLYWRENVPVWDLVAAIYAIEPKLFQVQETTYRIERKGLVRFGIGNRRTKVVANFDPNLVWDYFANILQNYRSVEKTKAAKRTSYEPVLSRPELFRN